MLEYLGLAMLLGSMVACGWIMHQTLYPNTLHAKVSCEGCGMMDEVNAKISIRVITVGYRIDAPMLKILRHRPTSSQCRCAKEALRDG